MDLHTWWRTRGVEQKQPHLQRAPDGARSEVKKGKSKKKRKHQTIQIKMRLYKFSETSSQFYSCNININTKWQIVSSPIFMTKTIESSSTSSKIVCLVGATQFAKHVMLILLSEKKSMRGEEGCPTIEHVIERLVVCSPTALLERWCWSERRERTEICRWNEGSRESRCYWWEQEMHAWEENDMTCGLGYGNIQCPPDDRI